MKNKTRLTITTCFFKKIAFLLSFIFVMNGFFTELHGQEGCKHAITARDSSIIMPVNQQSSINGVTYIKLYFHAYHAIFNGNPVGADIQRCRDMRDLLNDQFDGSGFQFFFNECEFEILNDNYRAIVADADEIADAVFCKLEHDDGIDIHVRPDLEQSYAAVAETIGGGELVIGGYRFLNLGTPLSLSGTLAHEMGHCFGLFHTFTGSCPIDPTTVPPDCDGEPIILPGPGMGDLVDDTPEDGDGKLDLFNYSKEDCIYGGSPACPDPNGGSYNPMTTNFMGYYGFREYSCQREFTQGQINKMQRDALQEVRYEFPNSHDLTLEREGDFCPQNINAITECDENNLNYIWSTGETNSSIEISDNGTYWVEVSDAFGNISKESITISDFNGELEGVEIIQDGISRSCNDSRRLSAEVSGGSPPYTYQWNTGETSFEIYHNNICPTEFEVTVSDDNGCSVTKSITSSIQYGLPDQPYLMDTDVSYNGLLRVRSELEITSTVSFTENAGILVERGGKLILNGGTLTKCEDADSWRGIVVVGNSNAEQPEPTGPSQWNTDQAGIVVTQNNAVIEYARTGIHTNYSPCDPWTDEDWGGVVYCEDTDFLHCRSGIGFMKYDFSNKSEINNCTFDGTNPVNGSSVGITVWDCDDIEIRKSRFYDNTISGYYSIDAGTIIKDDNDFEGNMGGIYTAASYPFGSYTYVGEQGANPNYFYNNFYGIFSNATDKRQGLKVINNEFFDNMYLAMGARGAHILRFQENSVQGGNGLLMTELAAFNSNQNNYIQNNGFDDVGNAIVFRGQNREAQFHCNAFTNIAVDDFMLFDYGSNPGEIRKHQGNAFDPAGNCFDHLNSGSRDIVTVGQTKSFEYYHEFLEEPCQIPVNSGNYIKNPTNSIAECDDIADGPDKTWTQIRNSILQKEATGDTSSIQYYDLMEEQNKLLMENIEMRLDAPDTLFAWLHEQDLPVTDLWAFGVLMENNKLQLASQYLDSLNHEVDGYIDFKAVQQINIANLLDSGSTLSTLDSFYLDQIATSVSPSAPYARAILGRNYGSVFTDQLPAMSPSPPMLLSQEEPKNESEALTVSPNPFSDDLWISIDQKYQDQEGVLVEIRDMNGKLVLDQKLSGLKTRLNLSSLASGIYTLSYRNGTGNIATKKIIKQ